MTNKSILWIFIFCFLCFSYADAEPLETQIQNARQTGKWDAVAKTIQSHAEKGDPLYQTALGQMYVFGLIGQGNFSHAFDLFKAAAEKGFPLAQNYLGAAYGTGLGTRKDSKLAVEWYRKAADQGISEAQYNLGFMYQTGETGAVDERKAIEWYEKAAAQNFALAWLNLGAIYFQGGKTIPQDMQKGVLLMQQAADAGVSSAQMNLGMIFLNQKTQPSNLVLAYYYLKLAGHQDTRGRCIPPALWIASRMERQSYFSADVIIRDELVRQQCMFPNQQAMAITEKIEGIAKTNPALMAVLKKMEESSERFFEYRKLMDEPPSVQVGAPGRKPYRGEMGFFQTFPSWEIVALNERDGQKLRSEIRPKNVNDTKIRERAVYEQTFNLSYAYPSKHLDPLLEKLRKGCGQLLENKIFEGKENGYPTYVMSTVCPSSNEGCSEMHFLKVIQGDQSLYFWHGEWVGEAEMMAATDASSITKISGDFSYWLRQQTVCDTSLSAGEKACPLRLPRL